MQISIEFISASFFFFYLIPSRAMRLGSGRLDNSIFRLPILILILLKFLLLHWDGDEKEVERRA